MINRYTSYIYYAWSALMLNEFRDINVAFNPPGYVNVKLPGDSFMETYGLHTGDLYFYVLGLVGFEVRGSGGGQEGVRRGCRGGPKGSGGPLLRNLVRSINNIANGPRGHSGSTWISPIAGF
eukprot:1192906-Prorocentrum_minimum.AAC.1